MFSSVSKLIVESTALLSQPTWQHHCMKPKEKAAGPGSLLSALQSYQGVGRVKGVEFLRSGSHVLAEVDFNMFLAEREQEDCIAPSWIM